MLSDLGRQTSANEVTQIVGRIFRGYNGADEGNCTLRGVAVDGDTVLGYDRSFKRFGQFRPFYVEGHEYAGGFRLTIYDGFSFYSITHPFGYTHSSFRGAYQGLGTYGSPITHGYAFYGRGGHVQGRGAI